LAVFADFESAIRRGQSIKSKRARFRHFPCLEMRYLEGDEIV
jgi:hypothetical protein